ncbi:MAG: MFS transporter, partial [Pseudomonadota bacterium]
MTSPTASEQHAPMSYTMFVVVVAALMGMNPLAIDIMLPAFGLITSHYDLSNPNAVHTVITFYLLGFGLGQLLVGTFADSFGRKPILLVGVALYTLAGLGCALAPNFEALLAARFVCGLASAAPRVVATAMVRDCYDGRTMARVMALAMTFFMAMPLFAPLLGQIIVMVAPWQWIFGFVVVYGAVLFWVCFSALPETIRPEFRRPIAFTAMAEATRSVLGSRQT